MATKRNQVTVFSDKITFPSLCSKCLGSVDLTRYGSSLKTKYWGETPRTTITRSASIGIPICRSCWKSLIRKERTYGLIGFVIFTALTFGLCICIAALGLIPQTEGSPRGFMNDLFNSPLYVVNALQEILGVFGSLLGIIWFILFLLPLACLISINNPHKYVKWPVKLEKSTFISKSDTALIPNIHTFSFENTTYAEMFAAANPGSAPSLDTVNRHIKNLKNENSRVRQEAAMALGKTMDPKVVEPLIQALKDESILVRDMAASALGKIGDVRALEALTEAKEDKSRWVRGSAKKALKKIKKKAS